MKLKPLGNRVVVDPIPFTEEDLKKDGITLLESSIVFQRANVVLVGPGRYAENTGAFMPMSLKPGNVVLFQKDGPYLPIQIDGKDMRLMREQDIDCVIE